MSVPGVGGTPQTNAPTSSAKANVDYESFLKLLVAELKNQDPTQPMDSTQYMAQLASFSQVEQSIQTNTKLDQLLQASQLSQRRRGVLRLQDVALQQELDIVEQLDRNLAVRPDDGAVEIDLLVGAQRYLERVLHLMPSRMIWEMSMRPPKLSDCP